MKKVTREEFIKLKKRVAKNEALFGSQISVNKSFLSVEEVCKKRIDALEDIHRRVGDIESYIREKDLVKRIDQLEKSDFATATRISTLLERIERLEERKPHKEPEHLLTAEACKHCGSKHFIIYMYNEWFKYKCSECGKHV